MSDDRNDVKLPVKTGHSHQLSKPGNLLDSVLSQLPPEQQLALQKKALDEQLQIDAEAKRADLRFQASTVDMANTLRQLREVENTTKSDYTLRSEYQTASGRTNLEVKKSNNTVVIVIAVVIGIIILMMFAG